MAVRRHRRAVVASVLVPVAVVMWVLVVVLLWKHAALAAVVPSVAVSLVDTAVGVAAGRAGPYIQG